MFGFQVVVGAMELSWTEGIRGGLQLQGLLDGFGRVVEPEGGEGGREGGREEGKVSHPQDKSLAPAPLPPRTLRLLFL